MTKIIDAVSIVLMHESAIFAIQRQYFLKSFPGYWAFPGGKVESDEKVLPTTPLTSSLEPRLWAALVREAQEELGIDLMELIANGVVAKVEDLGLAVTPEFNPYRFATYFFKVTLKSRPPMVIDRNEAQFAEWVEGKELYAQYERGELLAVPPVVRVIKELAADPSIGALGDLNIAYDAAREVPMIESLKGVRQYLPLSNTLPPAERTNCFLIGDQATPQILIDPSPKDVREMEKLKCALQNQRIDAIMLTHHHFDHHQFAPELARFWKVPIYLSQDTHMRITRISAAYFADIKTEILSDGDVLTSWLGYPVSIIAVPGHDEGQLALMPQNRAWFLAGDLFQGIGTVVVGDEEGDMAKYMATLEKVISLKPKVVYPSHGIALGSTLILEKTLEHRRMREAEVLRLHQGGKNEEEILAVLYSEIPAGLKKYALKNIHAHLKKLREEKRL